MDPWYVLILSIFQFTNFAAEWLSQFGSSSAGEQSATGSSDADANAVATQRDEWLH